MHFNTKCKTLKTSELSRSPQQLSPRCTHEAPVFWLYLWGAQISGMKAGPRTGTDVSWMFVQQFAQSHLALILRQQAVCERGGSCCNIL